MGSTEFYQSHENVPERRNGLTSLEVLIDDMHQREWDNLDILDLMDMYEE